MDKKILSTIKDIAARSIEEQNIAGINMLVFRHGKEQYYFEDGYADIESQKPISRDTIFRLYSMTKPVTGAAAMILMQRGEIDLLHPVAKYLPGFKNQMVVSEGGTVPANREVTLFDLLSMTSGLSYGDGETAHGRSIQQFFAELTARMDSDKPMTTVEAANKFGQCGLAFQPGEHWQYGTSADVMGAVIEVVSGKSFGQFLQDEIFAPLGMKDTGFFVPAEKQHRLATTYRCTDDGIKKFSNSTLGISVRMEKSPALESGGAGLVSTVDDYMRFTQMLMNKGMLDGVRILSPKTVEYFTSPQILPHHITEMESRWPGILNGFSYGNFMRIRNCGERGVVIGSKGEYGWDGALGVYCLNSPKDDLSIVYMIQRAGSGTIELTRRVRNIVYSAILD